MFLVAAKSLTLILGLKCLSEQSKHRNEHVSNGCGQVHQIFWIQSYNQYTKYIEEVRCNEYFAKPRFQEMLRALRIHLHCNSVYSAIKQILWSPQWDKEWWTEMKAIFMCNFFCLLTTCWYDSWFSTFRTGVAFCCFLTWCLLVMVSAAFEHIPYLLSTIPLTFH